jgi:putative Mg2+ transporter-C (MgtC) family protein
METFQFEPNQILTFLIQISFAMISGLVIGLEREYKGKPAGLKTNALVAIGAAVFVIISLRYQNVDGVDVTRVMSHVVAGIGFLGAGVILQKGGEIEGLTTAATIWCSAAAGCLAATSMYTELGILTLFVVLINIIFGQLNSKIKKII